MSYIYIEDRPPTKGAKHYLIGFLRQDGSFVVEHRTTNKRAAAARTSWLNGGSYCDTIRLDEEQNKP
jgi:hypothetical protein